MALRQQRDPIAVACSCGVPGCRELGWPHEWDPIAAGDRCAITPPPTMFISTLGPEGETPIYAGNMLGENVPHLVREPYERWGSGYACVECVEIHGG